MENSGKMILILVVGLVLFTVVCGYYSIGPLKLVETEKMDVYPNAVQVNESDILTGEFFVDKMYVSPVTLDYLLQLDDVKIYGVNNTGFEVFTWYLAFNMQDGWFEDDIWYDIG